jgi:tetratricopeptide (TPR) repeat protein
MRYVAFIAVHLLLVSSNEGGQSSNQDEILNTVHKHLYTAREDAIRLLEDVLQKDPASVSRWVALVHALDVNGESHFAERAARLALETHPNHPELFIARAKILDEASAWDQLDDLARLPGQEARATRLKEFLSLKLLHAYEENPPPEVEARFRAVWAQQLLEHGRFDPVPEVVMEGLKVKPNEPTLQALLPVAHALAARYDEALQEHAEQGFKQTRYGPFLCLGDCLLFKQQPRRAIASFNGQFPGDAALRRILAIAHARLGEYGAAEELLGRSAVDDLLRLRWDLERGREADLKQRVPGLLARHCSRSQGSWRPPDYAAWGGTVGEECRQAILWLGRDFPDRRDEIHQAFGLADPRSVFRQRWLPADDVQISARRFIAWLREAIPVAHEEDRAPMRRVLAHLLSEQQHFTAAAEALVPNVLAAVNESNSENMILDAVRWSLLHRRAEAEKLHERNPWMLVQARQLLAEIHCRTWNHGRIVNNPWREPAELVVELGKLSPGILAEVLDDLGPRVISAADRTPYIAVIEHFGALADAPVLISALAMTLRSEPNGLSPQQPSGLSPQQLANDRRSADALHACLLKLSGLQAPPLAPPDRLAFWNDWWRSNAKRIVERPPDK